MDTRYQVFISSTFADLKDERAKVQQAIMELDCIPAGMEIFPAIDEEQFEFIKRVIDDCDYYLLIIGGRYGSLSSAGISYTEMEYEYAIGRGIKVLAFLHDKPENLPLNKSEQDSESREKLLAFRGKVATNRLVKFWNAANELPGLVALSLSKTIKTYPAIGWIRASAAQDPQVYKELNELRKENQELKENAARQAAALGQPQGLAGLDDVISVKGMAIQVKEIGASPERFTWSTVVTWGKLFGLISPVLLFHRSDEEASEILSSRLYALSQNKREGSITSVKLTTASFETIRIQLRALNLITLTPNGRALLWGLTALGEQKLIAFRAIKKED